MRRRHLHSFTLIELLVVMGVIAILSAITLGAAGFVNRKAASSRAQAEIAAMEAGLERYKIDNGTYPATVAILGASTNTGYPKTLAPTTTLSNNASVLYIALSGKIDAKYLTPATTPIYMEFKPSQISTTNGAAVVQDPFGYPYGYAADTGTSTNACFNIGFFDLFSTGGQTGTSPSTNLTQWITNWKGS